MTKTKSTKRALLMSALALLMCVFMLIGSTFAWFTDTASTAVNAIQSGKLEVVLEKFDEAKGEWVSAEGEPLKWITTDEVDNVLWEPGCTYKLPKLRVRNAGNLALKYEVEITGLKGDAKLLEVIEFTGLPTNATLTADAANEFQIEGHMAEEAGNEYQNLKIDSVAITVYATQLAYESDSYGPDYDEEAVIGTYIELGEGEDLLAALASAEAGKPVTINLMGNVELPTAGSAGGVADITPASSVVIDGNGNTITVIGSGVTPIGDKEAPVTLKNAKIVDNSKSYNESAWELSYCELGGVINCVNVDFADAVMVEGTSASFVDCSFVGHPDKLTGTTQYAVWVSNGDATFTDCIVTGTRGIKICDQYSPEVGTVVIDGCTFNGISEKPGVAIDDEDTQDMNIIIKNSTFINCQAGDQGLYVYETDNTLPTVSNNIVESYTSLVEIGTKEELVAFANRVNGGDGMSGAMVKLTDNIDLAGMEWTPIGQAGTSYGATNYFQGIFDGQGHTISNMTIANTNSGNNYAAGFFGFIDAAKVTIRNVNFDNANVKGHHWTGVVAGYLTGNIEKCNVTNSTVSCTHANNDACGDKAGIIVGYVNNGLVNNCTASNSTVTAGRDAGQIAGASKTAYVANCTATNVTVTANDGCTGANIREDIIGRVL